MHCRSLPWCTCASVFRCLGALSGQEGQAGADSQFSLEKCIVFECLYYYRAVECSSQLYGTLCCLIVSFRFFYYIPYPLIGFSFQEVQYLSALQASIRILPSLVIGVLLNLVIGAIVHRVSAVWIVSISSILCAGSPLLMAVIQPSWPYWGNAFVAQLLQPVSFNALFTIGLIVITNVFPSNTQALAGAVYNTSAQFGSALGMAILQVISTITTDQSDEKEAEALMAGYRASFWTMFGFMVLCTAVGFWGLRKAGKVGLKQD